MPEVKNEIKKLRKPNIEMKVVVVGNAGFSCSSRIQNSKTVVTPKEGSYETGRLNSLERILEILEVAKEKEITKLSVFTLSVLTRNIDEMNNIGRVIALLRLDEDKSKEMIFQAFINSQEGKRDEKMSEQEYDLWAKFLDLMFELGDSVSFAKCYTKKEVNEFKQKLEGGANLSYSQVEFFTLIQEQYSEMWGAIYEDGSGLDEEAVGF